MAIMGISFSLVPAVMWPSVAYLVDEAKLGTAYGLMTMIQNIGLFGFNCGPMAAFTRIIEIRNFVYVTSASTNGIFTITFSSWECELLGIAIKPNK